MRRHIPRTTLCCVDCSAHDLAARALTISLAACGFDETLLLTDRPMSVPGVEVRQIAPLKSSAEYSTFMLTELGRHIRTEFVLVIQWDGYILDADAWQSRFFDYDYIGARWPHIPGVEVGNGGFSLRSQRLLKAMTDPAFVVGHPEDAAICITNRSLLEVAHIIRFAPPEVAERFAYERITDGGTHFGFHGVFNLPEILSTEELRSFLAAMPARLASSTEMLEIVLRYYTTGRMPEARLAWRRAVELTSEVQMSDFLLEHLQPKSLGPDVVRALKG